MRIFIFKSEGKAGLRAFSGDPGGRQLPSQFSPWHAVGVIAEDRKPPYNLDRKAIEDSISDAGYQLFRVTPKKAADTKTL